MRSPMVAIVLLVAGIALLIWGISATDSLASNTSELFQGAPSNKAIILMVIGAIVAGFGLTKLTRKPSH